MGIWFCVFLYTNNGNEIYILFYYMLFVKDVRGWVVPTNLTKIEPPKISWFHSILFNELKNILRLKCVNLQLNWFNLNDFIKLLFLKLQFSLFMLERVSKKICRMCLMGFLSKVSIFVQVVFYNLKIKALLKFKCYRYSFVSVQF